MESYAKRLAEVTAEYEKLKRRVEEKGNNISDRTNINNMRSAMKRMKDEIGVYNVRSAVAELQLQELAEHIQMVDLDESIATAGILPTN